MIGAGRLGKNIAQALSATHIISSLALCNRSFASAKKACQELGVGHAVDHIEHLPEADITWICCNDDSIPHVVALLAQKSLLKPGSFVIHSSGVLNSNLLAPLKTQGCSIASFHPLKAFKTNYLDSAAFNQIDCVMEGDEQVCQWLTSSFLQLGAYISVIQPENKAMYHAAACIASNYLITLAACSEELLLSAGLPEQQCRRMLTNLMQGNVTNLMHSPKIAEALTGPLARGDIKTLSAHLDSIKNPDINHLYKAAGLATLPLTSLSKERQKQIKEMLKK